MHWYFVRPRSSAGSTIHPIIARPPRRSKKCRRRKCKYRGWRSGSPLTINDQNAAANCSSISVVGRRRCKPKSPKTRTNATHTTCFERNHMLAFDPYYSLITHCKSQVSVSRRQQNHQTPAGKHSANVLLRLCIHRWCHLKIISWWPLLMSVFLTNVNPNNIKRMGMYKLKFT